jgi:hypothetical protein
MEKALITKTITQFRSLVYAATAFMILTFQPFTVQAASGTWLGKWRASL